MNNRVTYLIIAILAAVAIAIVSVIYLGSILLPVFIAFILAYLLDPLVGRLERWKLPRSLAIVLVFLLFALLALLLGDFLASSLRQELQNVQGNLPDYANRLYGYIPHQVKVYLDIETPEKVYRHINNLMSGFRGVSSEVFKETFVLVQKAFTSTLAFVLAVLGYFIIPVYLYYILKDLPQIKSGIHELIPERHREWATQKATEINEVLSAFIRGQLSVCAILAVLYSVGLYFIGIDLAVVIGTLAGLAFIIPYVGTVLGIVLSMLMALLKFQDLLHPLLCLGWFAAVQALEGGIITPKIVGDKVGLHPVIIMLALFIGGQAAGILGMLLAVPVTAVMNVFFRSIMDYYRQSDYYKGER